MSKTRMVWMMFCCVLLWTLQPAHAQTVTWSGRSWKVTSGHMAGVALGNPGNVTIDAHGYLHLQIVRQDGKWTAAELFTTENLGFGTYQWIVEATCTRWTRRLCLGCSPMARLITLEPTQKMKS